MQLIKNQINIEIPINIDTYGTCVFSSAIACGRVTFTMLKPKTNTVNQMLVSYRLGSEQQHMRQT